MVSIDIWCGEEKVREVIRTRFGVCEKEAQVSEGLGELVCPMYPFLWCSSRFKGYAKHREPSATRAKDTGRVETVR